MAARPVRPEPVREMAGPLIVRRGNIDVLVVGGLLSVIVLLRIIYVWTATIDNVVFRITDDAYYYFNTARNIVLGFGVSFDRMNPTNGFHPLWMLCLLPVFGLFPNAVDAPVRLVSSGLIVMAGITAWLAFQTIREWFGRPVAAIMVPVLGAPVIANHMLNGMETGLLLLLLFAAIRLDQRWRILAAEASVGRSVVFGLLLGLVFLSRLDSVFVIGCVFAAWAVQYLRRPTPARLRGILAAVITCGILGTSFVVWNVATFGHVMPISGAIKSSFPVPALSVRAFRSLGVLFHGLVVIVAFSVLAWERYRSSARAESSTTERMQLPVMLVALWIGSAVHFTYEVVFTKWGLEWWHFASHVPGLLFLAALLVWLLTTRLSPAWRGVCMGSVALLVVVSMIAETELRGDHHGPWLMAARWARTRTGEDSVFAMTDSGLFGYFSGRRTVNLDGVINSYGFQKALSEGRLGEFLANSRVTHLADYEVPAPVPALHRIRLRSGLFGGPVSELQAKPDAEVYRSDPYQDYLSRLYARGPICFVIWDLSKIRLVVR
jgi:hypothetical protein